MAKSNIAKAKFAKANIAKAYFALAKLAKAKFATADIAKANFAKRQTQQKCRYARLRIAKEMQQKFSSEVPQLKCTTNGKAAEKLRNAKAMHHTMHKLTNKQTLVHANKMQMKRKS